MRVAGVGAALFAASFLAGAAALFALAPAALESAHNRVEQAIARPRDPALLARHKALFVADLHADTLLWKRPLLARNRRGHADAPRLLEGGVSLQVFAAVTQLPRDDAPPSDGLDPLSLLAVAQMQPPRTWTSPLARARHQARMLRTAAAGSDTLTLVRSQADLARVRAAHARSERRIGAVLALEGLHALEGEAEHIEVLFEDGYRVMGLTHFFDNRVGGSLHGREGGGLTPFGREVVARLEALGAIIDLAHASPTLVADVLDVARRPVMISHTGFQGACDTPRNLPDAVMAEIAAAGGLIGVGFWAQAVCEPSPAGIARAIAYGVRLVGEDHVALGSDFDGGVTTRFDAAALPALTAALEREGLAPTAVAKVMGGNAARFFAAHLPPR